jgi:hypothetical protein
MTPSSGLRFNKIRLIEREHRVARHGINVLSCVACPSARSPHFRPKHGQILQLRAQLLSLTIVIVYLLTFMIALNA